MYQYSARFIRAVDADTVVLDLDLGFYQWRLARSYRLARINAPELNTAEGVFSRDALVIKLRDFTNYMVATQRADSFDRWIVELYADGSNISDWLVLNGHAVYQVYK